MGFPLRIPADGPPVKGTATGDVLVYDTTTEEWNAQPPAGGAGITTIQDEGVPLPPQPFLNFIGVIVTATNDIPNTRTNVTFAVTSDSVANISAVAGATVTDALNSLNAQVTTNASDIATNVVQITINIGNIATNTGDIATLFARNLTAGAGLTGGGNLTADRTFDAVANADGSIVVNPNDIQVGVISDTQHGDRGKGTLHEVATAAIAGFMSAADKTKLDGLTSGSAWDHIIENVADLPALVGGAHILTTGSWAFKNPIDLLGNKIEIPTGVTVLLASMGDTKLITSSRAGEVIEFQDGSAGRCWNLAVTNGNASALSAAMRIVTDLNLYFDNCDFSAGSGFAVDFSALSSARTFWNMCFIHNSATGVEIGNAANESHWVNCIFEGLTTVFDVQVSSGLFIQGGRMDNFTDGVAINGNMSTLAIADMEFENGQDGIDYNAGTVNRASVIGTSCVNMTEMIRWASASIPTLGLNLVGNTWNIATPLSGFTEASARVNLKACVDSSGQMSETAIVP